MCDVRRTHVLRTVGCTSDLHPPPCSLLAADWSAVECASGPICPDGVNRAWCRRTFRLSNIRRAESAAEETAVHSYAEPQCTPRSMYGSFRRAVSCGVVPWSVVRICMAYECPVSSTHVMISAKVKQHSVAILSLNVFDIVAQCF